MRLACELDPWPLQAFAGRSFANLRVLELRLGGDDYFGTPDTDPNVFLEPLLEGRAAPVLERLAITGIAFADKLIAALERSPLFEQLRVLDLSDSRFEPHQQSLSVLDRPSLRLILRGTDIPAEELDRLGERLGDRLG